MDSDRFDGLVRRFAQRASRRSVLKGLGGGMAVGALALSGHKASADGHKVEICHQPGTPAEQTLSVASASLGGHLGHGDYIGACCSADTLLCINQETQVGTCCAPTSNPCAVTACNADGSCGEVPANVGDVCGEAIDGCSEPPTCSGESTVCPDAPDSSCQTSNPCAVAVCNGDTCGEAAANPGAVCGNAANACSDAPVCTGASTECPSAVETCTGMINACTAEVCSDEGICGQVSTCSDGYTCNGAGCCVNHSYGDQPGCYWMETGSGIYCWIPSSINNQASCEAAGSLCNTPSQGACYKWATSNYP